MGPADTARDPRGFALKFYTDEGNWDLVGNNTPVFFVRDPLKFSDFIHSQKRDPATGLRATTPCSGISGAFRLGPRAIVAHLDRNHAPHVIDFLREIGRGEFAHTDLLDPATVDAGVRAALR